MTHECPSELGRCGVPRSHRSHTEGHPLDATVSRTVAALAERAGLSALLERLTVPAANAATKLIAVVLGMVAGADSITDLDLLRHGGMRRVFAEIRAPSTLGTFLRGFTFGHVRQLDAVASRLLAALVARTPLLPGRDQVIYLDVDDTVRATYGYAKAGAGRDYTGAISG